MLRWKWKEISKNNKSKKQFKKNGKDNLIPLAPNRTNELVNGQLYKLDGASFYNVHKLSRHLDPCNMIDNHRDYLVKCTGIMLFVGVFSAKEMLPKIKYDPDFSKDEKFFELWMTKEGKMLFTGVDRDYIPR